MMELERVDRGNSAFRKREKILQPCNVKKIYQNPMSWITIIWRFKTLRLLNGTTFKVLQIELAQEVF